MIQNNESPAKDVSSLVADKTEDQTNSTSKSEEVLGIPWDMKRDTIQVDLGNFEVDDSVAPTKRILLQNLAAIFDPIGLVSPVVVPAKVMFQELCVEKIGWDEPLPADKILRLKKWEQDLKTTSKITLPSCYYDEVAGDVLNCSLHGFFDASKIAYSAVIYLVYKTTKSTYVTLVASKTRTAPVKKLSIPVRTALKSQIEIESV